MAINSLSASSYGLSGLVSGMNTQEMVEKLLSGTQSKIDSATQKKTTLQYKQQMYRDVAAKLRTLQSSFLSFTSSTNLLSNSFYNTMSAAITPPAGLSAAFSITSSSNAQVGNLTMDWIKQLATARTSKTQVDASADVVGKMDQKSAANLLSQYTGDDAVLNITVGDKTATITDVAALLGGKAPSEVVRVINSALAGAGVQAEASYVNNKLQITAANPEEFISITGNTDEDAANAGLGTAMFGASTSYGGKGVFSSAINTDKYMPSFEVNLDGRQQSIHLDVNHLRSLAASGDMSALTSSISGQLTRYFGTGVQLTELKDSSDNVIGFKLDTASKSQKFTVTGNSDVMGTLGMVSGVSNKLNTGLAIKDLNFATELQGNLQMFSINGVEFSYSSDTQLSKIISDINNSKAGVKISYVESEDRFVIQNTETGAGTNDFVLKQTDGNFLSVLFGAEGGKNVTGYGVNKTMTSAVMSDEVIQQIAEGGAFTFNINGNDVRFNISYDATKDEPITPTVLAEKLNEAFKNTYGTLSDGTQVLEFRYTDDRRFEIVSNSKDLVLKAVKQNDLTNVSLLGFTEGDSTQVTDGSTLLSDVGIAFGAGSGFSIKVGGATVNISADEINALGGGTGGPTFDQIAGLLTTKLQAAGAGSGAEVVFDEKKAAFRVMGIDIPMEINIIDSDASEGLGNLFGQMSVQAAQATQQYDTGEVDEFDNPIYADVLKKTDEGQNAIFKLNGSEMERTSNSFTIDGLTYTLHSTTHANQLNPDDNDMQAPTQIAVTRDTEQIVEGLKEFLKLYNETVDYINELYRADATYKDYPPLTSAQKADMSENEIKLWEEKAKEGLLRNDSYLEGILSGLRGALNTRPDGSSIALYDLGVTTSFYTADGNFTEQGEGLIKSMVEADPEAIRRLFAGDGGIMEVLNESINTATRSTYGSPGTLVAVAGSATMDTSSTIYKQIKDIDGQLETLETRYWAEYNRYWKQFNSMEQLISQMNSQSGWLSQMLAG